MQVEISDPARQLFFEGRLQRVISERDGPAAHIVLEARSAGSGDPARITLDLSDLMTILRFARSSTAQRIRDAVA